MNIVDFIHDISTECGLLPKNSSKSNTRLLRYTRGSVHYVFVYKRQDLILYIWKVVKPENRLVKNNLKIDLHEPDSLDRIREFLKR